MVAVTLFTKDPCSLCDQVKETLQALSSTFPHQMEEIDITTDPELWSTYRSKIPVVKIGCQTLFAPISRSDLMRALREELQPGA